MQRGPLRPGPIQSYACTLLRRYAADSKVKQLAHTQQLTLALSTIGCYTHQIQLLRQSRCCCNACRDLGGIQLCKSRAQQQSLALATLQEVLLLPIQATMHTHQLLELQLLQSHLSSPLALWRQANPRTLLRRPHHRLLAIMHTSP